MKIFDLLFKGKNNKKINIEKTTPNQNVDVKVPKVIFENKDLETAVGQWLGIVNPRFFYSFTTFEVDPIDNKTSSFIAAYFGSVLKIAGIEDSEICILNEYDNDHLTFNCHFNNRNVDAKISLSDEDYDFYPNFIIDYEKRNETYDYLGIDSNPTMKLASYTIKNPDNGKKICNNLISPYEYYNTMTEDNTKVTIQIKYPDESNNEAYINGKKIEQSLYSLTLPIDIEELYGIIKNSLLVPLSEYPYLFIETEKTISKTKKERTNFIYLEKGQLRNFIITRGDKTIELDHLGNWNYHRLGIQAGKVIDGKINFSIDEKNPVTSTPISQSIIDIEEDVKQADILRKSLFK